jgi:hypothetical protein
MRDTEVGKQPQSLGHFSLHTGLAAAEADGTCLVVGCLKKLVPRGRPELIITNRIEELLNISHLDHRLVLHDTC